MTQLAIPQHSFELAKLHTITINQGFLVKLGIRFLNLLYQYLIREEIVIILIENGEVIGFVSCSTSSKGIMRNFILKYPVALWFLLTSIVQKPALIKPMLETYRAPGLSIENADKSEEIPVVELLSICVKPDCQSSGIGLDLLTALETELRERGVNRYKVIAGDKLVGANKFYLKNGFHLIKQISIHGKDLSNLYVKEIE